MGTHSEFSRSRQHSESEQSVASELSAAPDWLDEVVGPGLCAFQMFFFSLFHDEGNGVSFRK